ncbi:MAG TPA: Rieske 2Fe-2S domain-containing protein, partial [Chloroflexota bacterium]
MLKEQNELLTRVGPGTPCGEMLRRYWTPAALARELPLGGAPVPIRLLGEDLVLFRDDQAKPGLIGLHCSHRGADLSYARLEDGGLRCIYHGWLYDRSGRCLEQPGEPAGSAFFEKIRHPAYPCNEAGGVIWTYMGPGEPPLFPNYEMFRVPDDQRWAHKHHHACSYLQGDEGNIDSVHVRFLHKFLPGGKYRQDLTSEGREGGIPLPSQVPHCEERHFGVQIFEFHNQPEATYLQTKNFVLPYACAVGGGPSPTGDGYLMNWHVPIDDTHHWRYSLAFKRSGPLDPRRNQARESVTDEHYRFYRTKQNRYLQDREEQRTDTYAGVGPVFVNGDHLVTETAGEIQDRTEEHLAPTDAGIAATRARLFQAIKDVQ